MRCSHLDEYTRWLGLIKAHADQDKDHEQVDGRRSNDTEDQKVTLFIFSYWSLPMIVIQIIQIRFETFLSGTPYIERNPTGTRLALHPSMYPDKPLS